MIYIAILFSLFLLLLIYYAKEKLKKILYIINELDKVEISNEEKRRIASEYTIDLFHQMISEKIFNSIIKNIPEFVYKIRKKMNKKV